MRAAVNTFVSFPLRLLWHVFGGAQMQGMHPSLYPTEQTRHSGLRGTQDFHSGSGGLPMQRIGYIYRYYLKNLNTE